MTVIFNLLKIAMLMNLWMLADRFVRVGADTYEGMDGKFRPVGLSQWRGVLRAFLFLVFTLGLMVAFWYMP